MCLSSLNSNATEVGTAAHYVQSIHTSMHTSRHTPTSTSTHISTHKSTLHTPYPNTIGNRAPISEEIPIPVANRTSRDSSSKVRVLVDIIAVVELMVIVNRSLVMMFSDDGERVCWDFSKVCVLVDIIAVVER